VVATKKKLKKATFALKATSLIAVFGFRWLPHLLHFSIFFLPFCYGYLPAAEGRCVYFQVNTAVSVCVCVCACGLVCQGHRWHSMITFCHLASSSFCLLPLPLSMTLELLLLPSCTGLKTHLQISVDKQAHRY